jgi:hypothetical protein
MYYAEEAVCSSGTLITRYHTIWCLNLHHAENIHLCKTLRITQDNNGRLNLPSISSIIIGLTDYDTEILKIENTYAIIN